MFILVAYVLGGGIALLASVVAVVSWLAFAVPTRAYWFASVALMAAAPVALFAQGLPTGAIAGPTFAAHHSVANTVVLASLALAAWAASLETAGAARGRALLTGRTPLRAAPAGTPATADAEGDGAEARPSSSASSDRAASERTASETPSEATSADETLSDN